MKTFFDSSAFAKRYVEEKGSDKIDQLCQDATALGLSIICVPEIISALNRRVREKSLSRADYKKARTFLAEDIRDIDIIDLSSDVVAGSIPVMEKNPVRAMDALHIACAAAWQPDLFVSADKRQITAAKKSGLKCRLV